MAIYHVTPHRIGQLACKAKHMIGSIDRGIRTAGAIYKAVKHHVPDSKIKRAAEKGLSDYESIREKVRQGAEMP